MPPAPRNRRSYQLTPPAPTETLRAVTGFAAVSHQYPFGRLAWEVRSVNHRYLDVQVRTNVREEIPETEAAVRAVVTAAVDRGRVNVQVNLERTAPAPTRVMVDGQAVAALGDLKDAFSRLADPRLGPAPDMDRLPACVWMGSCIHGDELSGTEAALYAAYHLVAGRDPEIQHLRDNLVVLIDPLQNPDGRERFVHNFRKHRGEFIESNPLGSEHTEPWPSGRSNHYWFDMNRDWFLQSQQETVAKVKAYLTWRPQVYADAHEMGRSATYCRQMRGRAKRLPDPCRHPDIATRNPQE